MDFIDPEEVSPAAVSVIYYLIVFILAQISRKAIDYVVKRNTLIYLFLIELIATIQMCTCVYENGLIIKYYGVPGFFITVLSLLIAGGIFNRGAFVSPLTPIEQFTHGKISSENFLTIIVAQTIGGLSAFRCANALWYYSANYSNDHSALFTKLPCSIDYKLPFIYVMAFEVCAAFLLRVILFRLPKALQKYMAPITVATFLSFALHYIGVPALNPLIVSSRLQGCSGLDLQWFIMLYWCCPVVGWLVGAHFDNSYSKALRLFYGRSKKTKANKKKE